MDLWIKLLPEHIKHMIIFSYTWCRFIVFYVLAIKKSVTKCSFHNFSVHIKLLFWHWSQELLRNIFWQYFITGHVCEQDTKLFTALNFWPSYGPLLKSCQQCSQYQLCPSPMLTGNWHRLHIWVCHALQKAWRFHILLLHMAQCLDHWEWDADPLLEVGPQMVNWI